MPEYARVEREERVLVVTIERPDVLNALHPAASYELAGIFDEFESDPELWVAIITGAGDKAFCAGLDLKSQLEREGLPDSPPTGFAGLTERYGGTKPIVAAVNGIAMGGGFEIALACDLVVASERAVFALPEPRIGLAAVAGGIHRLSREIPLKHAMGMLLTGRRVTAEEGHRLGFVTDVVPHDELMEAARRWAADIAACAPLSILATKESAIEGLQYGTVKEAMNGSYPMLDRLIASEDFREGPRAFVEKRPPRWKGR